MEDKNNSAAYIGILELLGLVFIVLKFYKIIN